MFQDVLEQLLLQFLAPYVDGINPDTLKVGVWRGDLQLNNLKVKEELLALLGVDGFRIKDGRVKKIALSIPWGSLLSGKLSVIVEGLHAQVEQSTASGTPDAEIIKTRRESKNTAIKIRMEQLKDILEHQQAAQATLEGASEGFSARLIRRFVNGITVKVTDVHAGIEIPDLHVAAAAQVAELAVLSTDSEFKEKDDKSPPDDGHSIYKMVRIGGLGLKLAGNAADLQLGSSYIMSPVGATVKLGHDPIQQLVSLQVQLGTDRHNEITVARSQLVTLVKVQESLNQEDLRVRALLVDPKTEEEVLANEDGSKEEYGTLYKRFLINKEAPDYEVEYAALNDAEQRRMQMLEDVLSVQLLAAQRCAAEKAAALRRATSQIKEAQCGGGTWFSFKNPFKKDQTQALMEELEKKQEFEVNEAPQKAKVAVLLGQASVNLLDDRYDASLPSQRILSLLMRQTTVVADVKAGTDHRGEASVEFDVAIQLGAIEAEHEQKPVVQLQTTEEAARSGRAIALRVKHELLPDMCLLGVDFELAPLEVFLPAGFVGKLLSFAEFVSEGGPDQPGNSVPQLASVPEADEEQEEDEAQDEALEKQKQLVQMVAKRVPDKVRLDVKLNSPVIHLPVLDLGKVTVSLGRLCCITPKPCTYDDLQIKLVLSDMMLRTVSSVGESFEVLSPMEIQILLHPQEKEDCLMVGVEACVGDLNLAVSPQALQLLQAAPTVVDKLMEPPEALRSTSRPASPSQSHVTAESSHLKDWVSATLHDQLESLPEASAFRQNFKQRAVDLLGKDSAAIQRAQSASAKPVRVQVKASIQPLTLSISDSVVPLLRLRMDVLDPGVLVNCEDADVMLGVPEVALEAEVLNPRHGHWEPLLERFGFGVTVKASACTQVSLQSHSALLVNLVPSSIKRLSDMAPVFAQALETGAQSAKPEGQEKEPVLTKEPKFRAVNLTGQAVEVDFAVQKAESNGEGGNAVPEYRVISIPPTGSSYVSLDDIVLSCQPSSLVVRKDGGFPSEALRLQQPGCVVSIPGTDGNIVAELVTPSPAYVMLLIAPPLRVHNNTDKAMELVFHEPDADKNAGTPLPFSDPTTMCSADLVGWKISGPTIPCTAAAKVLTSHIPRTSLLLEAGSVCGVPSAAIFRADADQTRLSAACRAWVTVRPAGHDAQFSAPTLIGQGLDSIGLSCNPQTGENLPKLIHLGEPFAEKVDSLPETKAGRRSKVAEPPIVEKGCGCFGPKDSSEPTEEKTCDDGSVYFAIDMHTWEQTLPDPMAITTVAIRPTLTLLNALPIGNLSIGYGPPNGRKHKIRIHRNKEPEVWHQAAAPPFAGLRLYDLPFELVKEGLVLKACLDGGCPWSKWARLATKQGKFHSTESDEEEECSATTELQLQQSQDGASASVFAELLPAGQLRLSCHQWLVDRSGEGDLEFRKKGAPLPTISGVTLLPGESSDVELCLLQKQSRKPFVQKISMPPNFSSFSCKLHSGGSKVMTLQNEDISSESVFGASCSAVTLRPRLVLTNASDINLELKLTRPDGNAGPLSLDAGCSKPLHFQAGSAAKKEEFQEAHAADASGALATSILFRPVSLPTALDNPWSTPVLCSDNAAGSAPFAFQLPGGEIQVWSAEVAPSRGALAVSLRRGSDFVAVNKSSRAVPMKVLVKGADGQADLSYDVTRGSEVPLGWTRPFADGNRRAAAVVIEGETYDFPDLRRSQLLPLPALGLALSVGRTGETTCLTLEDHDSSDSKGPQEEAGAATMEVNVTLDAVGISLVGEGPGAPFPHELLYLHINTIKLDYQQFADKDAEELRLVVFEVQTCCQLPGRTEASQTSGTSNKEHNVGHQLLDISEATALCRGRDMPAVILANKGNGVPCLGLVLNREATSSRDNVITRAEVQLDRIDVTIDESWLEPLKSWLLQAFPPEAQASLWGVSPHEIIKLAGKPITTEYTRPPLPSVVDAQPIKLSAIEMTVWCRLSLKSLDFLPAYVRHTITVLSFSGYLTLDGARIALAGKELPAHRGSLDDFATGIASEYTLDFLKCAAGVLGKSSLLNLPAAPLKVGSAAVSIVGDKLNLATGQAASALGNLTMDPEYVARQKRLREERQINGASDGLMAAGHSLAQGVEGLFDVIRKPIEGARTGGARGFVTGVGRGLVGTVVKPIAAVGQAVADVSSGLSNQTKSAGTKMMKSFARQRARQPRLLFGELGQVRSFSELEADVAKQLGDTWVKAVCGVIPLEPPGKSHRAVLLLYPFKLLVVSMTDEAFADVIEEGDEEAEEGKKSQASPSAALKGLELAATMHPAEEVEKQLDAILTKSSQSRAPGVGSKLASKVFRLKLGAAIDTPPPIPARGLCFASLDAEAGVQLLSDSTLIMKETSGVEHLLDLSHSSLGHEAKEELRCALEQAASRPSHRAFWSDFYTVWCKEVQQERAEAAIAAAQCSEMVSSTPLASTHLSEKATSSGSVDGRGTKHVLEVYEVERSVAGKWKTPSLPTDGGRTWRFVDANGNRHPNLHRDMPQDQVLQQTQPPCDYGSLFSPQGDWEVEIKEGSTDKDGWQYSLAWKSPSWADQAGLFNSFRRRRWTRSFG